MPQSYSNGWSALPWIVGLLVACFVWLLTLRPSIGAEHMPIRIDSLTRLHRKTGRTKRLLERQWIDALIGELTVGRDPISALLMATESSQLQVAYEAWVAARMGGDVAGALMAEESELVRSVGACWLVASSSGAGLVKSLCSISESARDRERILAQVEVAIAEPRAAALVVALLPIVGLGMGSLLGSHPLHWLLETTVGRLVLLTAVILEAAGSLWAWRIIRSATESS